MDNWLASITQWLLALVQSIFGALLDWVHDAALWIFDGVLQAIAGLVASIPAPSFLSTGINIGSLFSGFPPFALFLLSQLGIGSAFAVISAGVTFRLLRKLFTLGQW